MRSPALFLLVLGCAPEEVAPPGQLPGPSHPPDAVLLVEDLPLAAADAAPLSADISALYPEYSALHARRLALTNELLPRLAVRAAEPRLWEAARAACAEALDRLDTLEAEHVEGGFHALGLGLWSAARHLPLGEWSPPIELTGRWVRVRLDERVEHPDPRGESLRISLHEFPFLEPAQASQAVEAAIDRARLTLIDPDFGEAIPEAWRHRMRATRP